MKKTRILSLLLASLLLLLPLSGCGGKNTALANLPETDELVIYLPKVMERELTEDYIVPYRTLYPDVNVRIVVVPGDEDYGWEEYSEKVVNEVLAGSGPDVLLLEYLPKLDVEKAARNYSFYDLTDLLDSDPDFNEKDYVDGVLDAVRVGGRIFTMPRSFRAPDYLAVQAKLDELGFDWDNIETTSDFIDELTRLAPDAAKDENFRRMLESLDRFRELFGASGIRLLDYEKQIVMPDEAELRKFLESYKSFYHYDYDATEKNDYNEWFFDHTGWYLAPQLMQGTYVLWPANSFYDLNRNMRDMTSAKFDGVLRMLPGQSGERVGLIAEQFAVNGGSKNVRNAYNFIKLLCSEEFMTLTFWDNHELPSSIGLHNPVPGVPVLRQVVDAVLHGKGRLASNPNLSDEEKDELIRQYTTFDRFTVSPSGAVYDMLWNAAEPYLQDERSLDDCIAELQNKLTFYLSE